MRISLGNTRAFKVSSLNILENIGNRRAFKVVSLNIMENVGNRREICLRSRTFPENATYLTALAEVPQSPIGYILVKY